MFSVNDLHRDFLLDEPPTTRRPLAITRGHEIKPLQKLRQEFCHFEERYVLADASSCAGTKLCIALIKAFK